MRVSIHLDGSAVYVDGAHREIGLSFVPPEVAVIQWDTDKAEATVEFRAVDGARPQNLVVSMASELARPSYDAIAKLAMQALHAWNQAAIAQE